jgi:LPXTG-motif cell wall-anchored protein
LGSKINADVTLKSVAVPLKNDNKISSFLQKNKKTLMYVGIALVVGVAGYYLYKKSKN